MSDLRYGDEGQHVCTCRHLRGEHDHTSRGSCKTTGCTCTAWRRAKNGQTLRAKSREVIDGLFPDGFLVRVAPGRLPSYCRWCKTKLTVTRRGVALCLTGGKCDVPQIVADVEQDAA